MPRTTRTLRPMALSATAAAALVLTMAPLAHAAGETERVSGDDRYETAAAISERGFADGSAESVVLTRGTGYADALTGSALAADKEAPLLLTQVDRVPAATLEELQRVLGEEGTIYVLGGSSAVSDEVVEVIGSIEDTDYTVERIEGENRYETAIAVAGQIESDGPVLVGTGTDYPDALSAGAAAGAEEGVVLLTRGEHLPQAVATYLEDVEGDIYAIGGPAAVALEDVETVEDISGDNRYETAVAVAEEFFEFGDSGMFALASGQDFPDALAGGASIGQNGGPVLLTQQDNLPNVTADYLEEITEDRELLGFVLGGEAAISDHVVAEVDAALNPTDDDDDDDDDDENGDNG